MPDAILELWQADADGERGPGAGLAAPRRAATFTGFGRASTDAEGHYAFTTVVPGAPFFAMTVFARGLLNRLFTRAYLPDAAGDPFLEALDADRRSTLLTTRTRLATCSTCACRATRETVFLTYPRHERLMADLFWPGDRAGR